MEKKRCEKKAHTTVLVICRKTCSFRPLSKTAGGLPVMKCTPVLYCGP